jgi:hypothetical protein
MSHQRYSPLLQEPSDSRYLRTTSNWTVQKWILTRGLSAYYLGQGITDSVILLCYVPALDYSTCYIYLMWGVCAFMQECVPSLMEHLEHTTDKKEINNYSTIDLWLLPECSLWLKPNLGKIPCTIQVANQPWDHNCLITSCSEVRSQEWYASIPRWEKFPTLMLIWHLNDFIDYTIVEKMSQSD